MQEQDCLCTGTGTLLWRKGIPQCPRLKPSNLLCFYLHTEKFSSTFSRKFTIIFSRFSDAPKEVSFTSSKANGIAVLGERVQFTCNATSLPFSSYELRHNNVLIRNSTNQVFKIAKASLADEGTYTCVAYNYLGYSASSSNNLTIHGKL